MDQVAVAEGHPRTDGHIYLAMINGRYSHTNVSGMTGGKGFPGIAMFMHSQENARLVLAHEMGHAHWLGHAPSPGAMSDPNPVDWDYPYGGDSMIAFAPWHPILGGFFPTTNKDLMAYAWTYKWISDFNWARFFDRTYDSGLPLAAPSPTGLAAKIKPGVPFVIGPKEAQALADYVDALQPYACGSLTKAQLETFQVRERLEPISPIPPGPTPVIVRATVRPKREIRSFMGPQREPTELEQLLDLPEMPKGGRR
jgi:hypothetical protein